MPWPSDRGAGHLDRREDQKAVGRDRGAGLLDRRTDQKAVAETEALGEITPPDEPKGRPLAETRALDLYVVQDVLPQVLQSNGLNDAEVPYS